MLVQLLRLATAFRGPVFLLFFFLPLPSFYTREEGSTLHILVNNVGMNIRKATVDYSAEEVSRVLNTNLMSFFELSR